VLARQQMDRVQEFPLVRNSLSSVVVPEVPDFFEQKRLSVFSRERTVTAGHTCLPPKLWPSEDLHDFADRFGGTT